MTNNTHTRGSPAEDAFTLEVKKLSKAAINRLCWERADQEAQVAAREVVLDIQEMLEGKPTSATDLGYRLGQTLGRNPENQGAIDALYRIVRAVENARTDGLNDEAWMMVGEAAERLTN